MSIHKVPPMFKFPLKKAKLQVDATGLKERCAKAVLTTSRSAKTPRQGRKPLYARCVEPFHIGSVKASELRLRADQAPASCFPGTMQQAVRNRDESLVGFVLDNLDEGKLRPTLQTRSSALSGADRVAEDFGHHLRPGSEAIRHPQQRATPLERHPDRFNDSLHQPSVASGIDLSPDEQPRKDAYGCCNPDCSSLHRHAAFICLNLCWLNLSLTHHPLMHTLRMAPYPLTPR